MALALILAVVLLFGWGLVRRVVSRRASNAAPQVAHPGLVTPARSSSAPDDLIPIEDDLDSESKIITRFEDGVLPDVPTGVHDLILVSAVALSDPGRRRKHNEDSASSLPEHTLFAVADGMGGYVGGEVASRIAVETMSKAFATRHFEGVADPTRPRRGNELAMAIAMAHGAIRDASINRPDLAGMGTTIVAARFALRKRQVYIAHVGDSRCYRLRAGTLKQMTTDHTLGEAGVKGPTAGYIRRAVGVHETVKVDLLVDAPAEGDIYLLCSDGLTKMVSDVTIEAILNSSLPRERQAQKLVTDANDAGGRDNVTVVLVEVRAARMRGSTAKAGVAGPS